MLICCSLERKRFSVDISVKLGSSFSLVPFIIVVVSVLPTCISVFNLLYIYIYIYYLGFIFVGPKEELGHRKLIPQLFLLRAGSIVKLTLNITCL